MLAERVIEWTRDWKQQGLEEGRVEGRIEGLQEGQIQSAREDVLTVLEVRFGVTPLLVRTAIERMNDLAKLKHLHRQALLAMDMEEFARHLAAEGNDQDQN